MTFCPQARLEFQIWNIVLRPESNIASSPPPNQSLVLKVTTIICIIQLKLLNVIVTLFLTCKKKEQVLGTINWS